MPDLGLGRTHSAPQRFQVLLLAEPGRLVDNPSIGFWQPSSPRLARVNEGIHQDRVEPREAAEQSGQRTVVIGVSRRARTSLAAAPAFQDERENLSISLYVIFRIEDRAVVIRWLHNPHSGTRITAPAVADMRLRLWDACCQSLRVLC